MVQMKEDKVEKDESVSLSLYIPHGSDERPTNVQIRPQTRYFISHMVQMKVNYYSYLS